VSVTLSLAAEWLQVARTFTEAEALAGLWAHGEDAWLREDERFRPGPWGRWLPSDRYLINDLLVRALRHDGIAELVLSEQLETLAGLVGRATVVCPGDPRLRIDGDRVRLAAGELGREPLLEEVGPLLQFRTHLPVLSLKAAAASEPAGEWGPGAEPQEVRALGWLRVETPGRPLNPRMFVAQVQGHSMDDARGGLVDGAWAVFEFSFHQGSLYDPGPGRPVVLVRGEFSDPETGSYAVKRWDRADAEVRLVSANGDKERYPDIVVPAEAADHLRIVATFTLALGPSEFARRPRPDRRPGLRLVEGAEGLAEAGRRLARRLASFFEGAPVEDTDEVEEPPPGTTGWRTRLVCLDRAAGGPQLEIGPLEGLPPFVKKLRGVGAGWEGVVLAANARLRPDRLGVAPGAGPWRWEAVGFEDEAELGLARLDLEALDGQGPALFRVDAAGFGQLLAGRSLAPGQHYRILLPPACLPAVAGEGDLPGDPLADGWRLLDLDLAAEVDATLAARLTALGLSLGEVQPRLEWALISPTTWRSTTRGEPYAVFGPGTAPTIQVRGLPGADEAPALLFLRGPDGSIERLTLPAASEALVHLGELRPGRWACAVLHPWVKVRASTLVFEVVAKPGRLPLAAWSVRLGDDDVRGSPHERDLEAELCALLVEAPPGWPVRVLWRDLDEVPLATLHADAAGLVDLSAILPVLGERIRREPLGDLILDLGELGATEIPHRRSTAAQTLRERLDQHVRSRSAMLTSTPGAWLTLLPRWFTPILELLDYTLGAAAPDALPDALDLAVWPLWTTERTGTRITRGVSRALILTTDLDRALREHAGAIDRVCTALGVKEALLSDGLRWTSRRRRNYAGTVWNLVDAVDDAAKFERLLGDLAEGS
jgi:hypothetical protein